MSKLTYLSLAQNELEGPLSDEIGDLVLLKTLRLNDNSLSGTLPMSLQKLVNLQVLHLATNGFHGTLMEEFGKLTSLVELEFHDNLINGTIPVEWEALTNLRILSIARNSITGSIPDSLCQRSVAGTLSIVIDCESGQSEVDCTACDCDCFTGRCRRDVSESLIFYGLFTHFFTRCPFFSYYRGPNNGTVRPAFGVSFSGSLA